MSHKHLISHVYPPQTHSRQQQMIEPIAEMKWVMKLVSFLHMGRANKLHIQIFGVFLSWCVLLIGTMFWLQLKPFHKYKGEYKYPDKSVYWEIQANRCLGYLKVWQMSTSEPWLRILINLATTLTLQCAAIDPNDLNNQSPAPQDCDLSRVYPASYSMTAGIGSSLPVTQQSD